MAEYAPLGEFVLGESKLFNPRVQSMPYLVLGPVQEPGLYIEEIQLFVDYSTELGENGIDYLRFSTRVDDINIEYIRCEMSITDPATDLHYVIKSIDRQNEDVAVECQLDLIDFMGKGLTDTLVLNGNDFYQNNHYRIDTALNRVFRAAGWSFTWKGKVSDTLFYTELSDEYTGTPFDILQTLLGQMDIVLTFNQKQKRCTAYDPYVIEAKSWRFLSEKVNLKSVDCKSSSYDLVTRIFPLGNNLDVSTVNGGSYFISNFSYTDRIIAAEWGCTDYTTAKGLLAAAKRYLRKACVPEESYNVSLIDLYSIDSNEYPYLFFNMGNVVFYYDELTKKRKRMQITKITKYPNRPENNEIELTYRAEDTGTQRYWKDAG